MISINPFTGFLWMVQARLWGWVKLEQIGIGSWVFEIQPFALPTCCTIMITWNVAVLPKVKWCFKLCTPGGIVLHHCLIIKGTLREEIEITEMMQGLFF